MNFNHEGPSNFSCLASFSSSDENDDASKEMLRSEMNTIDHQQQMVLCQLQMNVVVVSHHFHLSNVETYLGSMPRHLVINRDRETADRRLYNDYFSDSPVYNEAMFKRRYRMSHCLFLRILEGVQAHDNYFVQKRDGLGRIGLSPHQKIFVAMRLLTYGVAADATDEYLKIREFTALQSLQRFVRLWWRCLAVSTFDLLPLVTL